MHGEVEIHFSEVGARELAKRPDVRDAVRKVAETVARNVDAQNIRVNDNDLAGADNIVNIPVVTHDLERDPGTQVILAHPAGTAVTAKYGALTKAASAAGLQIHG